MRFAVRQLTKQVKHYNIVYPNDLAELSGRSAKAM